MLIQVVKEGWPDKKVDVHEDIKIFWPFRHEIIMTDGLIFKGWKLIIPRTLRNDMLDLVHKSHLGVVKCKKDKRKVQEVPQPQTAALPRPLEEEETNKSKQTQTEQTYEKH